MFPSHIVGFNFSQNVIFELTAVFIVAFTEFY